MIAPRLLAPVMALCWIVGACAVGPDFQSPAAPQADHYAGGGDPDATVSAQGVGQRFETAARIEADWWALFKSPKVDEAVAQAIGGNPGLDAARANLRQSQYKLQAGYGVFFPAIGADASVVREKFSPQEFGQTTSGSVFNLFSLGATVSYALDIWGGERRMVEGLAAQVEFERNALRGAYLSLTANVVDALIARAAYGAEIEATRQLISVERDQVRLAEVQARSGTATYATALALKSQLAATQAQIPALEQKLSQTDDVLATLVGRLPSDWTPPDIRLTDLSLPRDLPVSLPSELVRQRPDILMAESSAHAASAAIGVATAAMFPSLTISGGYGFAANKTTDLFGPGSKFWSAGADLATPVIQGDALWENRKAAVEAYGAAMAGYRQTVLAAFAQVADTLRALEHDAQILAAEDEALAAAARSLALVQANYASGLANYTEVLAADGLYHQAAIAEIGARAARYQDTVALFAALGGGWWNTPSGKIEAGEVINR